jgi:hypothetical protein
LAGHDDIFPHCLARRGDIKFEDPVGVLPRDFDARLLVHLLPRRFEVAQPDLNVASLGGNSEEKHEPVSGIDTAAADSLKVLDPKRPIREADIKSLISITSPM